MTDANNETIAASETGVEKRTFGMGLIGCGAFGLFCAECFSSIDGVKLVAVADVRGELAESMAEKFGAKAFSDPAKLIARKDVDIIHIATPPASHHELVLAAAVAGKHVLCEKPLAMNVTQGKEMINTVSEAGLIAPVNFVLRHNRITDAVKAIIDSGLIGKPLSARLTNCASDSPLTKEHWFWDKSVSGGIFIEHGVHFFDLYSYWFGPGEVISAHTETRENTTQEDRVTCTIRHDSSVIASHYHGFDQTLPMDRTEHRIVCELGDIVIEGWIPLSLTVDAVSSEQTDRALAELCPGCSIATTAQYKSPQASAPGRGSDRNFSKRIRLRYTPNLDKQAVYAESVRELLRDQITFLRDPSHERVITENNGLDAVAQASRAVELSLAGIEPVVTD